MKARKLIETPIHQRLTASIREAEEVTGLGETKIYGLIKDGTLDAIKVGSRTLIKVPSLLKLVGMDA